MNQPSRHALAPQPIPRPGTLPVIPPVLLVESHTESVLTVSRQRFHLVLTICTIGVWGLLVWLPMALWCYFAPKRTEVTKHIYRSAQDQNGSQP